jgi:hypothetical protein
MEIMFHQGSLFRGFPPRQMTTTAKNVGTFSDNKRKKAVLHGQ